VGRVDVMTDRELLLESAAQKLLAARHDLEQAGELKLSYEVGLLQVMAEDRVQHRPLPAP
jgi:hypothetical protein